MSLMPYGGLPNFGNATSGALMPLMAQNSMPSSLPEPQPARAAAAAATTPAATPLTNLHSTGARPHPATGDTATHTPTPGHDKAPRRHTTRRAAPASHGPTTAPGDRTATPSPSPHAPPDAGPPHDTPPHPRPRLHIEPRKPTPPKVPLPGALPDGTPTSLHAGGTNHGDTNRRATMQAAGASAAAAPATQATGAQSWPQQHPRHQPQPPSRAGHNNASIPPSPAPAAAFPTPPPRHAPPHPSPQHPLDDAEDLDPPPSEAEPGTNSDNRWLGLWRSVMDTAKTDPTRVPTPRELGELVQNGTDQDHFEEPEPALPPSHADLLAECWELRTMDMDELIAFDPSFYHLLGRESHGIVSPTTSWPVGGGPGSGTASHHAVMYVHGTAPDRMRRMSFENMIRPAAWRPENHDYPSFGPTACNPDTLGQLLQNFTIGKSQLGAIAFGELRSVNQHKILESGGSHEDQRNVRRHFA